MTVDIFTAAEAVDTFKEHTGYSFHPTVAGQLLKQQGAMKIAGEYGRIYYSGAKRWARLWNDMLKLAQRRASYGQGTPPIACDAPTKVVRFKRPKDMPYEYKDEMTRAMDERLKFLLDKDD